MSKLFKKVSGITLGLALCFGFSFSCSNKSSGQMTRAATDTSTYELISSVDSLEANKSYVIANGTDGDCLAMGNATNTNNRKTASISVSNGKFTANSEVLRLTLAGTTDKYTLTTENYASGTDGNLGTPSSGNKNYLLIGNEAENVKITFSGNAAVITVGPHSSRNIVRYNANNGSPLFSCYSSGQSPVYLYKEYTGGAGYTAYNVTFHYNDGVTSNSTELSSTVTGKIAKPNDPVREGYSFVGWYADEELETEFDFNSVITSDCDAYAKWFSYPSYCVTVHYNDGVTANSEIYSSTVTGKIANPGNLERSGYTFVGWYADSEFNTEFDFDAILENDCDLYAKWASDADAAAVVNNLISAIGELSYLKKEQIIEARNAYESLNEIQKGYVNNLSVLENAEAFLNTYIQFDNTLTKDATSDFTTALPNTWTLPSGIELVGKSKCYNGAYSTLKIGSSSATGSFDLKLSDSLVDAGYKITTVNIVAKSYNGDGGHISVAGCATQLDLGENYTEVAFDISENKVSTVTVSSSPKRAYIYGIKVAYAVESATLNSTLTIEGSLEKDTYYETETLDLSGLTIYAIYSDNSEVDVTGNVTLANNGVLSLGQTSVLVTYATGNESATAYVTGFSVVEYESVNFGKVGRDLNTNDTFDGDYYLAYVDSENVARVWNCNLNDASNSYIQANIVNGVIASTKPLENCIVTIASIRNENDEVTGYSLRVPSGKYVGGNGTGGTPVEFDNPSRFTIEILNNGKALITSTFKGEPNLLGYNFKEGQNRIRYYKGEGTDISYLTLFKKGAAPTSTNYEVFDNFVTQYMHFDDIETSNNEDTGECRGENGYYRQAIAAFNGLTYKQRSLIMDSVYNNVFERLYAWALANGEDLNLETCQFEALKRTQIIGENGILSAEDDTSLIIIFAICSLGAGALSAFYLVKKRKRAQ